MRSLLLLLLTVASIAVPTTVFAQWEKRDPENSMFQSQDEYHQFMGAAKRSVLENPEMKAMIPMLNDIALGREFGATTKQFGGQGNQLGMLSDSKVRRDLEMIDDQYKELQQLNSQIQKRVAVQIRSLDFSNSKDLVVQIGKIRDDAQKDLNGLLLPHQSERLQQIRMQSQLRRRNLVDILSSDPYRSELKITKDQTLELREAQNEIEADLKKEIAKLREKARDRLLSTLNPDQKKQVESMIGDTFEFSEPQKNNMSNKQAKPAAGKSIRGKGDKGIVK